ncbi:MAG: DUF3160 domain-containing protein [Myxococcales bacterium]|nr:DUF3160 domain-containing protein [Myxococcales bacterium]MCB9736772.1 DUF3160 domain-containing protein [Deltaproteobacteria bacterium]
MSRPVAAVAALLSLTAASPLAHAAAPAPAASAPFDEHEAFLSTLGRYRDLGWAGLAALWSLPAEAPKDGALSFDPATARYYDDVAKKLALTDAAKAQLAREGFVLARPPWARTAATVFRDVFTRDLPVLVTTDAILDAVGRSHDDVLADLEQGALAPLLGDALRRAQDALPRLVTGARGLDEAAEDVDLYLTVARDLLAPEEGDADRSPELGDALPTLTRLPARYADATAVEALLAAIDGGALDNGELATELWGAKRQVDWSQLRLRGHYTRSAALGRYFRAMMWLGRADLGFRLDVPRQLRAAGLLALALERSGAGDALAAVTGIVDLYAGGSGDLDLRGLLGVMRRSGVAGPRDLLDDAALARVADTLDAEGLGRPRIRSQIVRSELADPAHAMPPPFVQLLGQRFSFDAFALSHVVYDDIVFKGEKQLRRLPSGLDVMAVLGNPLAALLLKPEIDRWHHGANLAALRDVAGARPPEAWGASLYDVWLGALRTLNAPPAGPYAPEVMTRGGWAKKTLATQLASWAALRHATVLYTQESYSSEGGCVYPLAYVEPYPAFYDAFAGFARLAAGRLRALPAKDARVRRALRPIIGYYARFAGHLERLASLARKELAGEPFTKAEQRFLRHTVQQHDSGDDDYMPTITWDGWYMDLVYRAGRDDGRALAVRPTIADVHTDAHTATVLAAATGGVDLAIVAIDHGGDRAIYVGPVTTYYEVQTPASARLDDAAWAARFDEDTPPPGYPTWLAPYRTELPSEAAAP